jgi:hypothetical protein
MSDDQFDPRPKIELCALERIGRQLRGIYGNSLQDPLPGSVQLAVRSIEDAEHGLAQLKEAAHALRRAAHPEKDPSPSATKRLVAAWRASTRHLKFARHR